MAQRITDKLVKSLEAPAKGQKRIKDDQVRGFQIVVRRSGSKAFALDYTAGKRERRITIGEYPTWSVKAARDQAAEYRRQIDRGEDPLEARDERRQAATVNELCDLYERDHLPQKRDQRNDRQRLSTYVRPELGNLRVKEVRPADVKALHRKVTRKGKPTTANRVLALTSKLFTLAVTDYEMRPDNPAKGIPKNAEEGRERYLSQSEIHAVSKALTELPSATKANAIRWLMLTGCRLGEALNLSWDQIDWEAGVWVKPSAHTKQKRTHRVPLSAPALQLLQEIAAEQPTHERHVFPGGRPGEPLKRLHEAWSFVRKRAGVQDVRLHDLRHTYASVLVSAGLSLPMIGALLGHTTQATTQRYAHLADDPLREATERVGAVVTGAASAPDGEAVKSQDNVVDLRESAARG